MLGIDVGTSAAKAVLADAEGSFFAATSHGYVYTSCGPGTAEQDPEDWWDAVCKVTRRLLREHPEAAGRIAGIAISGQGVATVLLDEQNRTLRKAILWMDTRAAGHAAQLAKDHGDAIAAVSGKQPAAYNVEPKLLWVRENEPAIWSKAWKITTTTGFITSRLTGKLVMNHSDAGILLSYDLKQRDWSEDSLRHMQLPREIFAELAECNEVIGSLTSTAARRMGLPSGLPVVAGGEDTSSAGLAMGVVSERDVQLSMGMASTVYVPFADPHLDSRLLAFPHVLRGLTLMGGSMVCGGIGIEWLMKLLDHGRSRSTYRGVELTKLTAEATALRVGAEELIFLPYMAGELQPVNDGYARGIFFGLQLTTRRAHLLRAVMEGTAYAILHNLDTARARGAEPERILAVGGPTQNNLWCQIICDVTGLPLQIMSDRCGAAFGDAILAATGVGIVNDPLAMQRAHAQPQKQFRPTEDHLHYRDLYMIYRELYPRLADLFPRLAALQKKNISTEITH